LWAGHWWFGRRIVAESFEDLHVYDRARALVNAIYRVTSDGSFARDFGLRDQIRRAAVSIMSNIAEGFERGANTEFLQFLFIAKGSCAEVRAQLTIAYDQEYLSESTYDELTNHCRQLGAMLSNFITHLRSSKYKGTKFKPIP
jgi:four helix bundle protein